MNCKELITFMADKDYWQPQTPAGRRRTPCTRPSPKKSGPRVTRPASRRSPAAFLTCENNPPALLITAPQLLRGFSCTGQQIQSLTLRSEGPACQISLRHNSYSPPIPVKGPQSISLTSSRQPIFFNWTRIIWHFLWG